MFHPGETIVHQFIIPFMYNTVKEVIVTYKQNDRLVLIRKVTFFQPYTPEQDEELFPDNVSPGTPETNDVPGETTEKTIFSVLLSQQETLLFEPEGRIKMQLNVLTKSGTRATCSEFINSSGTQQYKKVMLNE